jgi:hypothetical protein
MLSITDLLDFIDLDRETVQIVNDATQLPDAEATDGLGASADSPRHLPAPRNVQGPDRRGGAAVKSPEKQSAQDLRLLFTEVPDSPHVVIACGFGQVVNKGGQVWHKMWQALDPT